MPFGLFRRSTNRHLIDRLHGDIVALVRQPELYRGYGVADTFEGRFEMLALLSALFIRRLARLPAPGPDIAQELTDSIFAGLDASLREMGVGDLTVPKRMKKLASAFLGRGQAYEGALKTEDAAALADALSRNVHGGLHAPDSGEVQRLVHYVTALRRALDTAVIEDFTRGVPAPKADEIEARLP